MLILPQMHRIKCSERWPPMFRHSCPPVCRFPLGTPPAYIKLATQCMRANPKKRPSFSESLSALEALYTQLEANAMAPVAGQVQ